MKNKANVQELKDKADRNYVKELEVRLERLEGTVKDYVGELEYDDSDKVESSSSATQKS